MKSETPTIINPKSGDLAIIREEGGSLAIFTGNINLQNDKLYRIVSVEMVNGELQIVAKQRTKIVIDEKLTEHEGYVEIGGQKMGMKEFLLRCVNDPDKVVDKYFKHSFIMKLLGKPAIRFDYILLKDASGHWDSPRKITLKEEFWPIHTFAANNYILTKF